MQSNKPFSLSSYIGNALATFATLLVAGFMAGSLFEWLFGPDELGVFGEVGLTLTGLILFFLIFTPLIGSRR